MKVLKVDPSKPSQEVIDACVEVLKSGGVFIYPSDTCYGIGADFQNNQAIEKIYSIKNRPKEKLFSVIVDTVESIEKIAEVSEENNAILQKYLPGQFTFILPGLNDNETIGIRIPNFPLTQKISEEFSKPFITTSANLAGKPSIYSFEKIQSELLNKLDPNLLPELSLDAGELPENLPSTVVDLTSNLPKVIRQGSATLKNIA